MVFSLVYRCSSSMAEAQAFEEQFMHRFSAQDEEFQRYLQQPAVDPPVVEAWRSRDARYKLDINTDETYMCLLNITLSSGCAAEHHCR